MSLIIGIMLWIFALAIACWSIKAGLVIIATLFGALIGIFPDNKKKGGSGS